jgi:lysine 6-dehydrogenase
VKASRQSAELNSPKVKVSTHDVNALDHQSLLKIFKGADVALSFIGPFYKFGVGVTRAAVEAKINFIDICDDYQVADEVLKMDAAATAAWTTVINGLGASPGVTQ